MSMFDEQVDALPASRDSGAEALRPLVLRALLFLAGLTVLSVFTAVHMYFFYRQRDPIDWLEAFLSGFATWYPWVLLGPGVFFLGRRVPFEPGRWRLAVLVHLPAALVFGVLHGGLRAAAGPFVDTQPIPAGRIILGQLLLTALSYWVLLATHQAWMYYRRYRARELRTSQLESKLAQAQLEVLRMQLHPHFLFNTLHAVSALVHRDPDAADEMISQLSDLLRMTLDNFGVQEVSLREELEFVEKYLDIQQTRFRDRLRVVMDVPAETLDARVPNQALQPIVENAIKYGVAARTGEGQIEIRARGGRSMLRLTVRDDGPGLPATVNGRSVGIGLANIRARLKQLYGPLATLDLANHPRGGTLVTLLVPQPSPCPPGAARGEAA